ncbi:MAG: redox-sensing transcriptional repressor Rex [Planctomycetota bacterium]|nr:redox-sensing transcriptional repressor Rex [Planctomycetota bacterium]
MANKSCIIRLSMYRNALIRLKTLNFVKVFSDNLADVARVTSVQVRKDFSLFGISGNRRGGYLIDELISQISAILGKDKVQKFIVIGIGNIGKALLNYPSFKKNEIELVAGFDIDMNKHNRDVEVPILPLEELGKFVAENEIKFGVISVPDFAAQEVLELMFRAGIKGVLNFAPICLKEPPDCVVRNINLETELENIIYFTNFAEQAGASR